MRSYSWTEGLFNSPTIGAKLKAGTVKWTIRIIIGAVLEERDLAFTFGESYREYQRQVPMLLPLRMPRRVETKLR